MAILTRLAGRIWNLICLVILGLFFAIPLAILASLTTGLAIFFTWLLASRMIAAAFSRRIDTWRSNDDDQQPSDIHRNQLQGSMQPLAPGPSLLRRTSGPRSVRPTNTSLIPHTAPLQGLFADPILEPDLVHDYGYGNDMDDNEVESGEALWLGGGGSGWRRRSDRPSPTAQDYYNDSVSSPPPIVAPAANSTARRSTTSVESRRSSRVLSAESVVRREAGEGV